MRSIAFCSDCNKRRARLVFVVAKNTRALLRIVYTEKHFVQDAPWQGLKPNSLSILYGPTKVVP
jgi:hypothetical protein